MNFVKPNLIKNNIKNKDNLPLGKLTIKVNNIRTALAVGLNSEFLSINLHTRIGRHLRLVKTHCYICGMLKILSISVE